MWENVTSEEWQDWRWQLRNRITDLEQLRGVLALTPGEEEGVAKCLTRLRMAITPCYASLIDPDDPNCPVRKQAIPVVQELHLGKADMDDPLHEDVDSPVPHVTHRYPDRVLFLVTSVCSMYCRHCTRRRFAGRTDRAISRDEIMEGVGYIRSTPECGMFSYRRRPIDFDGRRLGVRNPRTRAIPHVEIIRIGTRTQWLCRSASPGALCHARNAPMAQYAPIIPKRSPRSRAAHARCWLTRAYRWGTRAFYSRG